MHFKAVETIDWPTSLDGLSLRRKGDGFLASEPVGVDDPGGLAGWHGDELQHPTVSLRADHEKTVLAVVFVLDQPDGVGPCVGDVGFVDPASGPTSSPPRRQD